MTPTKQLQVSKKSSAKHQLTAAAAISDDDEENDSDLKNFIKIDRFQPLMLLEFASPSEMVVVERPLLKIMEALPEGFFRDRYGT